MTSFFCCSNPIVWGTGTRSRLYNSTGFFFLAWAAHYLPFYLMGRQLFLHHYLPAHLASCLVTGALLEFVFNVDPVMDDDASSAAATALTAAASASASAGTGSLVDGKERKRSSDIGRPQQRRQALGVRSRLGQQSLVTTWIAAGAVLAAVIGSWYYFAPLTYGKPALTVPQVVARKWLGYDLHFAK